MDQQSKLALCGATPFTALPLDLRCDLLGPTEVSTCPFLTQALGDVL